MSPGKSREERILYLIRVARIILVRADALVQGDTEYLRDELASLLATTDVLIEKMDLEQALLALREELHAVPPEDSEGSDYPRTGVRVRP